MLDVYGRTRTRLCQILVMLVQNRLCLGKMVMLMMKNRVPGKLRGLGPHTVRNNLEARSEQLRRALCQRASDLRGRLAKWTLLVAFLARVRQIPCSMCS